MATNLAVAWHQPHPTSFWARRRTSDFGSLYSGYPFPAYGVDTTTDCVVATLPLAPAVQARFKSASDGGPALARHKNRAAARQAVWPHYSELLTAMRFCSSLQFYSLPLSRCASGGWH